MTVPGFLVEPDDRRWASALANSPHDVYDTRAYVLAEAQRIGAEAVGFLVVDDDRVFLLPLLIRADDDVTGLGGQSMRDAISPYGYPGIVMSDTARMATGFADACVARLLEVLRSRAVCTVFVRLHPLLNADIRTQLHRYPVVENGVTVSIDLLQSEARIWAVMSKGHKSAIHKAQRAGFSVEIGAPRDHFADFAAVYAETLQRLRANVTYDFGPDNLRRLAELENAHVAIALLDSHVAGAYLFFERDGIVQMHLGGTRSVYMRRSSPSNLLIHEIALWAKARNNTVLHLGGGLGGSADDGLFMFKAGFSPRRHVFRTLRLVADDVRYEELVRSRAEVLAVRPQDLLQSPFFPAYRADAEAIAKTHVDEGDLL